jgi:hypothetical protein
MKRKTISVLILLAMVLQLFAGAMAVSAIDTAADTPIFQDNFNGSDFARKWTDVQNAAYTSNGKLYMSSGMNTQCTPTALGKLSGDAVYEFTFTVPGIDWAGCQFNMDSTGKDNWGNNGYMFFVNSSGNAYLLGTATSVSAAAVPGFALNAENAVRIEYTADTHHIKITDNGNVLFDITDAKHTGGRFDLASCGCAAQFDDVKIWGTQTESAPMFQDYFSNLSNWTKVSGTASVSGNRLFMTSNNGIGQYALSALGNLSGDAVYQYTSIATSDANAWAGCWFNMDGSSGYLFYIRGSGKADLLGTTGQTGVTDLAVPNYTAGNADTVRIEYTAATHNIKITVNGTKIIDIVDATHTGGQFRLASCGSNIQFGEMQVWGTKDIASHMERAIFQRGADNMGTVKISGYYADAPKLDARLVKSDGTTTEVIADWTALTKNTDGTFSGGIQAKAGGWYTLELRTTDASGAVGTPFTAVQKIGVGDIFLTSGQSNSVSFGGSPTTSAEDTVSTYDPVSGTWVPCKDPQPANSGYADPGSNYTGGSAWPTAGDLLTQSLGVPVGFVHTGYGGAAISEFDPANAGSYYYTNIQPMLTAMKNFGGVKAILWHQGETDVDSSRATTAAAYTAMLNKIIAKTREDAGFDVPWMVAHVSYNQYATEANKAAVRQGQQDACNETTVFLGPDTDILGSNYRRAEDNVHFNAAGLALHGAMWANCLLTKLYAMPAVEAAAYPTAVNQADSNTQAALNADVEAIAAAAVKYDAVTAAVTDEQFTAAVAGDADDPDGTDGSYSFRITLSAGSALTAETARTSEKTVAVTATPYTGNSNADAVAAAKSAVEGGTYTYTQAEANDEAAVKAKIAAQINALQAVQDAGVNAVTPADITLSGFTAAQTGTASNPAGANGSFTFTAALTKGTQTATTAAQTGAITATAYTAPVVTKYSVAVDSAIAHGTITASPASAAAGDTITLSIAADAGYRLRAGSLKENGTAVSGTSFPMPAANVTVTAQFERIPTTPVTPVAPSASGKTNYKIASKQITGGKIRTDTASVAAGASKTYTFTPDAGYKIKDVIVDGKSVGAVPSYTFQDVSASHTITVEYAKITPSAFIDVKDADWFAPAVRWASENNIMNGVGGSRFAPNDNTTRAMIVAMLYRQAGSPDATGKGVWYDDARAWAMKTGVSDGTNMLQNITREQLAAMLWREAGKPSADTSKLNAFTDGSRTSAYAKQAVAWAIETGILTGKGHDLLDPTGLTTRAETALMFMRFANLKSGI